MLILPPQEKPTVLFTRVTPKLLRPHGSKPPEVGLEWGKTKTVIWQTIFAAPACASNQALHPADVPLHSWVWHETAAYAAIFVQRAPKPPGTGPIPPMHLLGLYHKPRNR